MANHEGFDVRITKRAGLEQSSIPARPAGLSNLCFSKDYIKMLFKNIMHCYMQYLLKGL